MKKRLPIVLIMFCIGLPQAFAAKLPCTFTFDRYPNLCVEVVHLSGTPSTNTFLDKNAKGEVIVRKVKQNVQVPGGEVRFYIWEKGGAPKDFSAKYDVSDSIVMPNMYNGPCYTAKFYETSWKKDESGISYFSGKTNVMPGIYRVDIKVKKKTDQKYATFSRLIPISKDDPRFQEDMKDSNWDDWVTRFTYQFLVPAKN